eukprot:TRINITY_DN851_c0_g1_i1.p1 TRINITY_DN851_c0_g1~~TRINITY_DN851_c0_g1_i1.p1  ORF type:complete len:321 (+),score=55.32 TRINITY_DN851_c0_g1_i1:254-1216(+)
MPVLFRSHNTDYQGNLQFNIARPNESVDPLSVDIERLNKHLVSGTQNPIGFGSATHVFTFGFFFSAKHLPQNAMHNYGLRSLARDLLMLDDSIIGQQAIDVVANLDVLTQRGLGNTPRNYAVNASESVIAQSIPEGRVNAIIPFSRPNQSTLVQSAIAVADTNPGINYGNFVTQFTPFHSEVVDWVTSSARTRQGQLFGADILNFCRIDQDPHVFITVSANGHFPDTYHTCMCRHALNAQAKQRLGHIAKSEAELKNLRACSTCDRTNVYVTHRGGETVVHMDYNCPHVPVHQQSSKLGPVRMSQNVSLCEACIFAIQLQ